MILLTKKGISLIEVIISLAIGSIVVAGSYSALNNQQKTHTVQEEVVDMQQNARVAVNRMMREIRITGFGNVSMVLPVTFGGRTFNNVLNPDNPADGSLTIVSAYATVGTLTAPAEFGQNTIVVAPILDADGHSMFDTGDRGYISIGGVESYKITSIVDNGTKTISLNGTFLFNHPAGTPIFGIRAVTYQVVMDNGKPCLQREENLGEGIQLQADGIEAVQFGYFDANGNPTGSASDIRLVRVTLTARTGRPDPEYRDGDGYRRRQLASNIHLKNMTLE